VKTCTQLDWLSLSDWFGIKAGNSATPWRVEETGTHRRSQTARKDTFLGAIKKQPGVSGRTDSIFFGDTKSREGITSSLTYNLGKISSISG
jgi:hypothetical protein